MSVGATGTQPLTYQWMLNGTSISTANASTYTVSGGQTGVFTVSVTDANSQSVLSEAANVTMLSSSTSVAFITPSSGAMLSGTVRVQAAASAATEIDYYVDGILRSTTTIAPFLWTWNTAVDDDGAHTIIANVYIGNTLTGTSPGQSVTVNNGGANICGDPNEPNNSSLTATPMALNSNNTNGIICTPTDVDWFKVNVTNAGLLQITLQVPAGEDYDLELYGPDNTWLAGSYNGAGIPESIQYDAAELGTYYFRVYGYPLGAGDFNPTAQYIVSNSLTPLVSGTSTTGTLTNAVAWSGVVEVTGDVTILAGGVLTIQPGTLVRSRANSDDQYSGIDPNHTELILDGGALNVLGTADSPVVFTSDSAHPHPGDWYGIRVVAGDVTMSNCVVEDAVEGIRFESADTRFNNYNLGNVTVENCSGDGVWTTSGQYAQVTLNNFQLWTNGTGLNANGPVTMVGGQAMGNGGDGLYLAGNQLFTGSGLTINQNGNNGVEADSGNPSLFLSGCTVTRSGSVGIICAGGTTLSNCMVTYSQSDGVRSSSSLQITGCTLVENGGWGLNAAAYSGAPVGAWNNLVQSNGGGMVFTYDMVVGIVSNTIIGNAGTGLQWSIPPWNNYNEGESAAGITGNVISSNGGVGVEINGSEPAILTLTNNDIYSNTTYDLRNDSDIAVVANGNYWAQPTTFQFEAGQTNLSRIYDSQDNPYDGQVLIQFIRTGPLQSVLAFTQQPQSVIANVGDTVMLSPAVAGATPISFQWFDDGLAMPDATNVVLSLPDVTAANSGGYFLVISNISGALTSSIALVAVIQPTGAPTIVLQPQSQSILAGAAVSFSVVAAGTGPLGYQWQKDDVAINGAISPSYVISAVSVTDAGAYTVVVTNAAGAVTSHAATLTVNVLTGSVINRTITTNGAVVSVSLVIVPPAGTPGYLVEEVLPNGFNATNISAPGSWNATNSTITWGPFGDGLTRILTYTLLPPNGFNGTAILNGEALLFGATATTGGDSAVSIGSPPEGPTLGLSQVAPGLFGVSISGAIGQLYRIDASQDLGSGTWTPLVTVSLTRTPFTFVDLESATNSIRFYRITVLQ